MDRETYMSMAEESHARRVRWFQEARFGMFIHWGLYSQLGRGEWVMNREFIPFEEYEKLADTWKPMERPMREWARLAKQAGMKYMVMTTKHHEGFCLWDTQQSDFNAVKRGPKRDLVREYVEACREFGLKVGLYYSLGDWRHPDACLCAVDEKARRRFLDFTQGCVRELMSNYGKIDILFYDLALPMRTPEEWESYEMNAMVRELQPDILINNRSRLPEDYGTPEGHVTPEKGRTWESCMTFNGAWGYMPSAVDWLSARHVLRMLQTATAGGGNLLLNVGPAADGSFPSEAIERLEAIGKWLELNGEAVYGQVDRFDAHEAGDQMDWYHLGNWTLKGNVGYFWCSRWVGPKLVIGGLRTRVNNVLILATGEPVDFEQTEMRLVLKELPEENPDQMAGICVFKVEFDGRPEQSIPSVWTAIRFGVWDRSQAYQAPRDFL